MEYHFLAQSRSPGPPSWKWRTAPLFLSFALHLLVLAAAAWWTPRPRTVQWVDLRLALPDTPAPARDQVSPTLPSPAARPLPAPPENRPPPVPTQARPQREVPPGPAPARVETPVPATEPVPIPSLAPGEPAQPEEPIRSGESLSANPTRDQPLRAAPAVAAAGEAAPGPASPVSFETGEREHYLARLREQIEGALEYPATARRMRWTGTVLVSFLVSATGAAQNLEIRTGCGYPLLDREALQAVRRAAPFAAPPQATEVVIPIVFELH